ncbi:MAG: 5-(carboxyamino)imidazole ribonucleotide synthase [Chitinophagales bacterium]|nr:5-(carboxyamino)imidazole ribonucleotide synthase [Chitinophagales bacterium]MDW8418075.1 5-(carboxyamino)imidazole ribonucleotide synthase [Chitinophagales bacterium]
MNSKLRIGILGGGQLGRMLLQAAADYPVITHVLENDPGAPAAHLCHHFVQGDIRDFETVYRFGKSVDVLTIEIEHVNIDALYALQREKVKIFPNPDTLRTIKDKGLQKEFYHSHGIPTAPFMLIDKKEHLHTQAQFLPAALKLRQGGYDGKGVQLLHTAADLQRAFDAPCVLEKLVEVDKEIAVIVARNDRGETAVYPPVEMVFDPRYNLVDYLLSPARLTEAQTRQAQQIALQTVNAFGSSGIFAIEMFLDKNGNLLVNETAPRAHNSGHQSIEGNYCSQYDMQMRVLLNLPPGNTATVQPSLMLNLIGEPNHSGQVCYTGLHKALEMKNVYVHIYGKSTTKPGRKMGHITILGNTYQELIATAEQLRKHVKVISETQNATV